MQSRVVDHFNSDFICSGVNQPDSTSLPPSFLCSISFVIFDTKTSFHGSTWLKGLSSVISGMAGLGSWGMYIYTLKSKMETNDGWYLTCISHSPKNYCSLSKSYSSRSLRSSSLSLPPLSHCSWMALGTWIFPDGFFSHNLRSLASTIL